MSDSPFTFIRPVTNQWVPKKPMSRANTPMPVSRSRAVDTAHFRSSMRWAPYNCAITMPQPLPKPMEKAKNRNARDVQAQQLAELLAAPAAAAATQFLNPAAGRAGGNVKQGEFRLV